MHLAGMWMTPIPGLPEVAQLNSASVALGSIRSPVNVATNVSYLTNTSSGLDLGLHPGMLIRAPTWCVDPGHRSPVNISFFSISTPTGLADALGQVSRLGDIPASVAFALTFEPAIVVLEQDVSAADVVLRASRQRSGSIELSLPVLLTGPPFPVKLGLPLPPSPVALDLSSCIGCLVLSGGNAHVYLADLHLTGLGAPGNMSVNDSYSGLSSSNASMSLPLWAFRFNRSPGIAPCVHLHNVTLTLPHGEFQALLTASMGSGLQQLGVAGMQLQVGTEPYKQYKATTLATTTCRGPGMTWTHMTHHHNHHNYHNCHKATTTCRGPGMTWTHRIHKTYNTHCTHSIYSTYSTRSTHGAYSTHSTHRTRMTYNTHSTHSTHMTCMTCMTYNIHRTHSIHRTHNTHSTHKTDKTHKTHKTHMTHDTHDI